MGVDVTHACISSIGLADDLALLSNDVFKLQNLVLLTEEYCAKNHVELVPEKTKLLCFVPKGHELSTFYYKLMSPVALNNKKIPFVNDAEHIGITRAVSGNMEDLVPTRRL